MTKTANKFPNARQAQTDVRAFAASGITPAQIGLLKRILSDIKVTNVRAPGCKTNGVIVAGPAARLAGTRAAKDLI